ncbi:MAG: BACON domain-containing protein [Alistipes sp.]|nr:BACON domain-containing protein [Alistipes sp.]
MKRLLVLCALLGVVACTNDMQPKDSAPVITPEKYRFDIPKEGGSFQFTYEISGAVAGMPFAADSEAEWIRDIDVSTDGIVEFVVECNDTPDAREATITLRYPAAAEFPEVVVNQAATTTTALAINVTNVDYAECTAEVTPEDATASYIIMIAEKGYFASSYIEDSDDLIAADETYFRTLMSDDITLEKFLADSGIERHGKITQRWEDLSQAKEYVIYSYGIDVEDDNYRRTTPVYHHLIEARLPERHDVAFALTVTAEGPDVSVEVAPEAWDGYYMVQFVEDTEAGFVPEGEPFGAEREVALAESFFYVADHLYYFDELTAEEVMLQLGHRGATTIERTLNANHKYMVMTYAIASDEGNVPMVVSHPVIKYFTTGNVELSTMTFEVDICNIKPRSVDIRITPSTDEQYTAVVMYASNLPEGSPEEQLEYINKKYAPLELSGVYEEHIDQLPPATEFILAVYGYYAGVPTTGLYVHRFATAKDGAGGNTITEVRCTAYDLKEVVALEPYYSSYVGYADYFMSVEVVTAEPSPTLHFDIFPKSVYEEYGVEAIRESLLEYSYTSSPDWALCSYGNEYVVCGLAEDEDGYVGEMFVSEPITFQYEDRGDAETFVELYKEYTTSF